MMVLLGDVALSGLFLEEPGKNPERFKEIAPLLQSFPLVLANLEAPAAGENEFNPGKKGGKGVIHYTGKTIIKEVLPLLNIKGVSLANNHIYDCGRSGVRNTIACLETAGIQFTGAGYTKEHIEPIFFDISGKRIAFMAYLDQGTNPCIPGDAGIYINFFDEMKVKEKIKRVKKVCDSLVLSLHWGRDYSSYPTLYQQETSYRLIEAGADIIMGHHSHTLQPYEKYKTGIIFYSLGSFCYGDFYYEGKLRALKRKTKKSITAVMSNQGKLSKILPVRELKGNRIVIDKKKKNNRRMLLFLRLSHRFRFFRGLLKIKELVVDRLIEYFFGYYRNPLVQLFSFSNLAKVAYIKRDYKKDNS